MIGMRPAFAFCAVLATLAVLAVGNTSSTGQVQDAPGVAYGGLKDEFNAWLRLDPGRRAIAALLVEWAIAPQRCSNRRTYSSVLYAGYDEAKPILVDEQGRFRKTIVDRYRVQGSRHEEVQTITGTVTDEAANGSISGRVRVRRPNGRVLRCDFGPQTWHLSN